jgi:hypothetical protein
MTKNILSLPGGGIRGILAASHLVALEKQTGRLTRDCFSFVGGTSTGALLTAAIAAGVPAYKSLDVYLSEGRRIFSPTNSALRYWNLLHLGRQFDARVLHEVLANTLGKAATWTINDSPIDLLITAGDMRGDCWYFTKDRPSNAGTTGKAALLDAAVASGCATTYHDPWEIPGFGPFSDGGCVSLADPVLQNCVEAFSGNGCYGSIDPADARVISLGTGFYKATPLPKPPGSLLDRIKWVTSSLVGSSRTIAAASVERQWPGVLQVFDSPLPADIDEADVDQISALLKIGQEAAAKLDWPTILGL